MCVCAQSKSEASLVAMDFSGKAGGRVIQNPTEAQSAEREEGQAWRVRRGEEVVEFIKKLLFRFAEFLFKDAG